MKPLRISQVGLRGIVGPGLTAAHVIDFACAFGTFLESPGLVLVARDPRQSGHMLREGVMAGLLACGHDVADLGMVSTPVLQHAIRRLGAAGGVSIGASHNAADWNALKFFASRGTYLSTAEANELLDIYHLRKFQLAGWDRVGRQRHTEDAIAPYIDLLARHFDLPALRRFRVVIDCCNGSSAPVLERLRQQFGLQFILLNARLNGFQFAHNPEISAATVDLQVAPLVRELGADAGFVFDVDSDRTGIATDQGEALSEELPLALLADHLLASGQGKLVLTNICTTSLLEWIAERRGGSVIRVPVGRQAAMDALAAYKAEAIAVAGEGTGAVMMPQFEFVYDGIASMLAIVSMMQQRNQKLSAILSDYPRFYMLKGSVPLSARRIPTLLAALKSRYADGVANTTDGLRIDWPGRWFHVRVSQTEPIVRVICEQQDQPPETLFAEVMEQVREMA